MLLARNGFLEQTKESSPGFTPEFKKFFLLAFTKELIIQHAPKEFTELEGILRVEKKENAKELRDKLKAIGKPLPPLNRERISPPQKGIFPKFQRFIKPIPGRRPIPQGNQIPQRPMQQASPGGYQKSIQQFSKSNQFTQEIPSPSQQPPKSPFKNIGPIQSQLRIPEPRFPPRLQYLTPTPAPNRVDLLKLNPLLNDGGVQVIEVGGPGQNVIVSGSMGRKKSTIALTQSDIEDIIRRVSQATKIPAQEGVFKVALGNIVFSAIISDVVGSKFVVKKMVSRNPFGMPPPGMLGRF